jgi:hypothetical protein
MRGKVTDFEQYSLNGRQGCSVLRCADHGRIGEEFSQQLLFGELFEGVFPGQPVVVIVHLPFFQGIVGLQLMCIGDATGKFRSECAGEVIAPVDVLPGIARKSRIGRAQVLRPALGIAGDFDQGRHLSGKTGDQFGLRQGEFDAEILRRTQQVVRFEPQPGKTVEVLREQPGAGRFAVEAEEHRASKGEWRSHCIFTEQGVEIR